MLAGMDLVRASFLLNIRCVLTLSKRSYTVQAREFFKFYQKVAQVGGKKRIRVQLAKQPDLILPNFLVIFGFIINNTPLGIVLDPKSEVKKHALGSLGPDLYFEPKLCNFRLRNIRVISLSQTCNPVLLVKQIYIQLQKMNIIPLVNKSYVNEDTQNQQNKY